jgi:putative SOS response-associated peptidase YedK
MCGRYALSLSRERIEIRYHAVYAGDEPPGARDTVAPTQSIPIVIQAADGTRQVATARWGLIPGWAKRVEGSPLINARAEGIEERPSFRVAIRCRRCLVPADGFYEWKRTGGPRKQPFYFQCAGQETFSMAGIWEVWRSPEGEEVRSVALITTAPNALCAEVHDRMPAILRPEDEEEWLSAPADALPRVLALLKPYAGAMRVTPLDTTDGLLTTRPRKASRVSEETLSLF